MNKKEEAYNLRNALIEKIGKRAYDTWYMNKGRLLSQEEWEKEVKEMLSK